MSISVLMSVYQNEKPEWLDRALKSIWTDQTLKPAEIILVEDGPLTDSLERVIEKWQFEMGKVLIVLNNEINLGLTKSLNKGLKLVTSKYIARMDSDDVAFPDRFEKQFTFLEIYPDISLVGGGIQEINENDDENHLRLYPDNTLKIIRYLPKANPFAHSSVMFRKELFLKGFCYNEKYRKNQDLELWFRIIKAGYQAANLPFPVLYFRRTSDTYKKRMSWGTLKSEFVIYFRGIYSLYGIFTWRYIYPLLRLCVKILPSDCVAFVYHYLFKKNNL